jgi:hypothetical protein
MAFDLSTTNRKAVRQIEKLYDKSTANPQLYDKSYSLLYNKSTANPQQIEQVEFELNKANMDDIKLDLRQLKRMIERTVYR